MTILDLAEADGRKRGTDHLRESADAAKALAPAKMDREAVVAFALVSSTESPAGGVSGLSSLDLAVAARSFAVTASFGPEFVAAWFASMNAFAAAYRLAWGF